jgi:hypothetical protein
MTLYKKIARASEIRQILEVYSHEMGVNEYCTLRNDLNNLDIQIEAEKRLINGDWKKPVKTQDLPSASLKTNRCNI